MLRFFLFLDQAIVFKEAITKPHTYPCLLPTSTSENPDPHDPVSPVDDL